MSLWCSKNLPKLSPSHLHYIPCVVPSPYRSRSSSARATVAETTKPIGESGTEHSEYGMRVGPVLRLRLVLLRPFDSATEASLVRNRQGWRGSQAAAKDDDGDWSASEQCGGERRKERVGECQRRRGIGHLRHRQPRFVWVRDGNADGTWPGSKGPEWAAGQQRGGPDSAEQWVGRWLLSNVQI